MLSQLHARFVALQLKLICVRHCSTIRISCSSTRRLWAVDRCTLQPAVHHVDLCLGFKTWASPHLEEKFRRKDNVASDYNLVYRAPMLNYVRAAQGFCTGPPLLFCGLLVAHYFSGFLFDDVTDSYMGLKLDQNDMLVFLVSYYLFNAVLYLFVSRYALRIYRSKDNMYKSIFQGLLPWKTKELQFKKGDVVRKPSLNFLPWKDSQYRIGRKKVIILEEYFRRPVDFNNMFKQ